MNIPVLAALAALFSSPLDVSAGHGAWQCRDKVVRHFTASCDKGGQRLNSARISLPLKSEGRVRGGCKGGGGGNCGVGKGGGGGNGTGNEGNGRWK